MKSLLVLSLLLSLSVANPGLQAAVSVSDLNQVLMIAYAFGLTTAHFGLGDFDFDYDTSFGPVAGNFTNIEVTSISVDYVNSVFSFQSPDSITYSIYGLSVLGTTGYSIAFDDVPLDPGQANFTLSNTNITADISVVSVDGKPQLIINSYTFQLGPIVLDTSLPPSFNTVINQVIATEEPIVSGLIPGLLKQYFPVINKMLAEMNLNIQVPGTNVAIGLSLADTPSVLDSSVLVVGLAATVTEDGKPVSGGAPAAIPAQGVLTEGIQIGVTDAVVNSILTPLWPLFSYDVDSLPEWLGGDLTTDMFDDFLPQLSETYGKGLPVMLSITSGGPIAYSTNGNINVDAHLNIDVKVRTWPFHWTIGATFEVKADLVLSASVKNNVAHACVEHLTFPTIRVQHNFIGTIVVELLRPAIDIVKDILLRKVNDKLKNVPINLPDGAGSFVQTDDVVVKKGFVLAGIEL